MTKSGRGESDPRQLDQSSLTIRLAIENESRSCPFRRPQVRRDLASGRGTTDRKRDADRTRDRCDFGAFTFCISGRPTPRLSTWTIIPAGAVRAGRGTGGEGMMVEIGGAINRTCPVFAGRAEMRGRCAAMRGFRPLKRTLLQCFDCEGTLGMLTSPRGLRCETRCWRRREHGTRDSPFERRQGRN